MSVASKISIHAPIPQTGVYGYLLWLRQNMPTAYAIASTKVPALAAFETALKAEGGALGCGCGLGDDGDFDISDIADDASDLDTSSFTDAFTGTADTGPITTDLSINDNSILDAGQVTTNLNPATLDMSTVDPGDVPSLPPIAAAPAAASSTGSIAGSSSMASSLPAIAAIVGAVAGVTVAALNHSTASINASTVAKTQGAAQLQLAQALAGGSPLASGVVMGPNGSYIAAVTPSLLSSSIGGVPLWVLMLGAVGAVMLAMN
jgi:hypothetical protein